jgi:hypothetical protein
MIASKARTRVATGTTAASARAADEFDSSPQNIAYRQHGRRRAAVGAERQLADTAPAARLPASAPGHADLARVIYQQPLDPESPAPNEMRPIRKINEILPYDDYEPDPEAAAQSDCPSNLCPCPEGADCPACCPDEKFLRRLGRGEGEPDTPFIARNFAHIHYCWEPTNMYHRPIYFEDVALERYGHTRHYLLQPFVSGTKFAVQLLGLPYQMVLYPPCTRQYSLGYYRPGECVPYKYYQIPLNAEAALVEAGLVAGGYFLFAPGVGP